MKILVTGANGFVGTALCSLLKKQGYYVRAAVRCKGQNCSVMADDLIEIGDIGLNPDWSIALKDINVVVHLASRAHVLKETLADPLAEYRRINVEGTVCLAKASASTGVCRFIFLSSVGVNGESTKEVLFTEEDEPAPKTPYAVSKWEAEKALSQVAETSELEIVKIRAPLVYGPLVKGNFLTLLQLIKKSFPLPLSSIKNKRSLIYVENLVDLISCCVSHKSAANQVFLASDEEYLSTSDLIRRLANIMGCRSNLFSCNEKILGFLASFFGKKDYFTKLCSSLQIESNNVRKLLNWFPPFSVDDGLKQTVSWYLKKYV